MMLMMMMMHRRSQNRQRLKLTSLPRPLILILGKGPRTKNGEDGKERKRKMEGRRGEERRDARGMGNCSKDTRG